MGNTTQKRPGIEEAGLDLLPDVSGQAIEDRMGSQRDTLVWTNSVISGP